MEDAWESYRDNNPPKGQARFYYKDNVEYWKDGFRNAISTLKCENCKHFFMGIRKRDISNCELNDIWVNKIFGCIEFEKKESEL